MSTVCFQRRTDHLTSVLTSLFPATIKTINCVRSSHQQHLTAKHHHRPAREPICHAVSLKWLSSTRSRVRKNVRIQGFDINYGDENSFETSRSCTSKIKSKTASSGMRDSWRRISRGRRRNMAPGSNMKGRDLGIQPSLDYSCMAQVHTLFAMSQ